MTLEELKKVRFRMQSHLAMEDEHIATYVNDQYGFMMIVRTPKKDEFTFGKAKRHFVYRGVTYKTLPKFMEAIKDVNYVEKWIFGKK